MSQSVQPAVVSAGGTLRRAVFGGVRAVVALAIVCGAGAGGYVTRATWLPLLLPLPPQAEPDAHDHPHEEGPSEQVTLSEQAQKNLRLTSQPLKPATYWKTLSVPGIVVDRPGSGDRGVVAPTTGVVTRIHKVAGDDVRPGDVLFAFRPLSESLHQTQTELFKSSQEVAIAEAQKKRLAGSTGAVAEARLIEVDSQIIRLGVAVKAYRQELLNRGLSADQIAGVAAGTFVNELPIAVPTQPGPATLEVQDVKAELGQQVPAGQTLCTLANHERLAIEGRAFRDETGPLERAMAEGWPVAVDFEEEPGRGWGELGQTLRVSTVANTVDPETRTFRFLVPLDNQSRKVEGTGGTVTLWRFRPGQRVRLLVRVDRLDNVFVLPADAVARDGADEYVFRRNGDTFDRKPVHVLYRDRREVVVANDGSVPAGLHVAQAGAAQLNRMVKSQAGTAPKGFHVHADGSVHMGNH